MIKGAYQLKGLRGPVELYTRKAHADYIIDKTTGAEYIKGDFKVFEMETEEFPKLVEESGNYEFITKQERSKLSTEELLRDAAIRKIIN